MKTLLRTALIVLAGALSLSLVGAPAPAPAPATPAGPTIQQRIDALLKRRLRPEPLPVSLPNPFQMSGGIVREASAEDIAARAGEPDGATLANAINQGKINANPVEVLATVSSRFKLGGIIAMKDQLQLVINGVPRKEGDSVAADWNGALVFVKIVRLSAGQLVLRYGEAEITMKF
jgi:hypothetical protein